MADTPTSLWRAALRPRMLGLLVVLLAAAAVCGRLGAWQLERAEVRGVASAEREAARIVTADPEPLTGLLAPGETFSGDLVARKAVVTGTYDDDATLLVTGREHDGRTDGYLVLTPLRVPTADGEAVLPVVRGWSPTADVAAAPAGDVEVVGWLQVAEEAGSALADGRTDAISAAQLLAAWGGPIYTGYLVVQSSDPQDPATADGLDGLDPPTRAGSGLNVQNLAYAAQWWIFGLFAVGLWWRLVRDEAAGRPPLPGDQVPQDAEPRVDAT
ncbi:SURF1 family protein [Cellulomonas dongxiuzhuiae]|uniref:SURF1-like protein n=1 Tax=Cellulomonas dongxiuzhuiae TaxID=2819979 RepID=A0ABX8GH78_9CELL|nr:SURF1 family protein [Cellulomonas dongxiuzhuiae]MBO3094130.1 SURF1 family protein [Cellulomonas dongxiuzhuiae]QWC15193.1 SURF1 family protein [Cellulomonas dongxiuzhuiae]